jgi:FtsP/CotA-like multicopper oxidase with cupredoxin domain
VLPADENTTASSTVDGITPGEETTTVVGTMDLSSIEDAYMGLDLLFTSGALEGVYRKIGMYMGGMRMFHLTEPLPAAPAVGDTFVVARVSQRVDTRIRAVQGQKILLRISNVSVTRLFTLASTIPMTVVGIDAKLLRSTTGENQHYTTNSVDLGGGQTLDAIVDTAPVPPGTYLLYTTNLQFLTNDQEDFGGLMTEIEITAP